MTLKEFIETYEGFDWENGEVVVVNQRTGTQGVYRRKLTKEDGYGLNKQGLFMGTDLERIVWNWTHTAKTMLIIL